MAELLETRAEELRDAQQYLSKVDDIADHDVLPMITALNSMVYQTAATLTDVYEAQTADSCFVSVAESEGATKRLRNSRLCGESLLKALSASKHGDGFHSTIVQLALQSVLVQYVQRLCTMWYLGQHDPVGPLMDDLYSHLKRQERPSVAGRWRALSRAHLMALFLEDKGSSVLSDYEDMLMAHLMDILLSGLHFSSSHHSLLQRVQEACGIALHNITTHALELRAVTGERIVSRDLELVLPKPGERFDTHRMENEDSCDGMEGDMREDVIFCTTQLGLIREEWYSGDGREPYAHAVTLLKPKVILASAVDDLWAARGLQNNGTSQAVEE
ncbi:hypothetical protein C8Q74DRAFT_1374016 [Fomes fomentarius]|nr:hypothetical protein C8Q74DRAFT_1374016 [Fomes fomentarius]